MKKNSKKQLSSIETVNKPDHDEYNDQEQELIDFIKKKNQERLENWEQEQKEQEENELTNNYRFFIQALNVYFQNLSLIEQKGFVIDELRKVKKTMFDRNSNDQDPKGILVYFSSKLYPIMKDNGFERVQCYIRYKSLVKALRSELHYINEAMQLETQETTKPEQTTINDDVNVSDVLHTKTKYDFGYIENQTLYWTDSRNQFAFCFFAIAEKIGLQKKKLTGYRLAKIVENYIKIEALSIPNFNFQTFQTYFQQLKNNNNDFGKTNYTETAKKVLFNHLNNKEINISK